LQTDPKDGAAVREQALFPEFEGKHPLIHEDAQEKEIEIRPEDAHLISDFFTQQVTIHALQHTQIPKRFEDFFLILTQNRLRLRRAEVFRKLTCDLDAFGVAILVLNFASIDLQ